MSERTETEFRRLIVPHFDGAYNLAHWITGSDADAADVLQDSCVRAFRFLHTMNSENPRAWFFQIVRNTAYTLLKSKKKFVDIDTETELQDVAPNSEDVLLTNASARTLHEALEELPPAYREILVLRELEEAKYEEITEILQIPVGTVMSRLSRARNLLQQKLSSKRGSL